MILAEVAGGNPADSFSVSGLVAILSAIGTLVAGIGAVLYGRKQKAIGAKEQKDLDSVTISNTPLHIKMEDHFVTRREFDHLRGEIRLDVTDMKNLFEKTMAEIKSVNTALTDAIEDGIKEGRMGRVALWNEVNPQGKEIAALKATGDVASQIGKLAEAIKTNGKNTPSR